MQKFYVDQNGAYLGCLDCSVLPSDQQSAWLAAELAKRPGAVEVPAAPLDARAIWNGRGWDEPEPAEVVTQADELAALKSLLVSKGLISEQDVVKAR